MQDHSNSIANSLESLQSCTKPSKYGIIFQLELEKKYKPKYGTIFQLQVEKKWKSKSGKSKEKEIDRLVQDGSNSIANSL